MKKKVPQRMAPWRRSNNQNSKEMRAIGSEIIATRTEDGQISIS